MNRMTQTINARASKDDNFTIIPKKRGTLPMVGPEPLPDPPSLWTRFVSWLKSVFFCRLPFISKKVKKKIKGIDSHLLRIPESLSGIQDKNWWIIKTANLPVIWIMGGPGAPIETFVTRLAEVYNFHHVNVGEMLQGEISKGTSRPELAKKLMERGVVIPRRFLNEMIKRSMAKAIKGKRVKGFLFSDFPTTFSQAKTFTSTISGVDYIMVLKFDEHTTKLCAYEQLRQQTYSSRSVCKTKSDLKISVEERLNKYIAELRSLEGMKGHKMKLIDAELQIREVFRIIMKWIERAMIMHDMKPPPSVQVPVQENYKYSY